MIKLIDKIKSWHIILFSALLLITGFAAIHSFEYVKETSARKNGSLKTFSLTRDDFVFDGVEKTDTGYITTYNDAKLLFEQPMKLSMVRFTMTYSIHPGEIVLYYRQRGDTDFSEKKRRWAYPDDYKENGYIISLPVKDVDAVRIDPTMYRGNRLTFSRFEFNSEKSFGDYFGISYSNIFDFIIYTAVISACLKYAQELILKKFD